MSRRNWFWFSNDFSICKDKVVRTKFVLCLALMWLLNQKQSIGTYNLSPLSSFSNCHKCMCWETGILLSLCSFSSQCGAVKNALFTDQLCHYVWHLMLKISSDIYLVKFHFRRLKSRTLMFITSYPRRNGFRHVLSQQEIAFFFFFSFNHLVLLPNITEVMESLVTFGCCVLKELGLEFVGVN